jgi:phosphate-selective porin OprO and OprP
MEQKLDALQKQRAANTAAAAKANTKAGAKVNLTSANAAIPVRRAVAPSDVVVTMPGNRPTICTADNLNCAAALRLPELWSAVERVRALAGLNLNELRL